MAGKSKLPKSIKKFIRKEKARIKREILDIDEQRKMIAQLYERFLKNRTKEGSLKKEELKKKKIKKVQQETKQSSKIKAKELVKT